MLRILLKALQAARVGAGNGRWHTGEMHLVQALRSAFYLNYGTSVKEAFILPYFIGGEIETQGG